MLKTYLNTVPYTKFIVITDSLYSKDPKVFEHLIKQHLNRNQHKVHYFVFEGVFKQIQNKYRNSPNIVLYDFVSDSQNWLEETASKDSFEDIVLKLGEKDIVSVDSLSNIISLYGIPQTYSIFNGLKNKRAIQQIIVVLHKDLLEGDYSKISNYFDHLSTISLEMKPKIRNAKNRIEYSYKKSGGKVINQIEEYSFEGENLVTNKIEKPDPKKIIQETLPQQVNPEELSTFRIGLTDEEKLSREKVVLPYLPPANQEIKNNEEGKIFYQLDEVDDWDEEDPDDDLDI